MGKLLFIRGGAVGDFILTMPAIELVRSAFPELEIEILGYPSITSLALESGLADRHRSIEHATMAPFFAPGATLDPVTCDYFKGFDVIVSYLYDPDSFFSGNLVKVGVETLIQGPFRMDETPGIQSAAEQLAAPLKQLALYLEKPFIEVSYGESKKRDQLTLAIHPGSGSPSKNWSFERWADLAEDFAGEFPGTEFLIISGEAEIETIGEFLEFFDEKGLRYHHAALEALPELGKRLQACDLYWGHDSGISHLAASTGLSGMVLFGSTNPEVWAPRHPAFDFIQAPDGQLGNLTLDIIRDHKVYQTKLNQLR